MRLEPENYDQQQKIESQEREERLLQKNGQNYLEVRHQIGTRIEQKMEAKLEENVLWLKETLTNTLDKKINDVCNKNHERCNVEIQSQGDQKNKLRP